MRDTIAALINEMVCTYRQINGCGDCPDCDPICEDAEVIAALEAGIEALGKQIPQKASYIDENYGIFECPTCKTLMDSSCQFKCWHYCMNCGQAFDWSEDEEAEND